LTGKNEKNCGLRILDCGMEESGDIPDLETIPKSEIRNPQSF